MEGVKSRRNRILKRLEVIAKFVKKEGHDLIWEKRDYQSYGKYRHRLMWRDQIGGGQRYFQRRETYMTFSEFECYVAGIFAVAIELKYLIHIK